MNSAVVGAPDTADTQLAAALTKRERRVVYWLVAFALWTVLIVVTTADPIQAAIPMLGWVIVWAISRTRLMYLVVGLIFMYQITGIVPYDLEGSPVKWAPPLVPVYSFLNQQLPIHVSGVELCYIGLFAIAGIRALLGVRIDSEGRQPGSRIIYMAMLTIVFAVFWMEVRGVVKGGADVRQSLWQFHGLIWLPIFAMFLGYCFRTVREANVLAWMFTAAALFKIAWGVSLFARAAWPFGLTPAVMTGHDDSILFVTILFLWISIAAHHGTKKSIIGASIIVPWILYGLMLNNRRIAYVGLGIGLLTFYILLQGKVKRAATRAIIYSIPFIAVYLALGKNRDHGIWKPASMIMSVSNQKDASSQTRDIENFNLIQTLRPNLVMGTGWGHEYNEVVQAYDISAAFAQYRFIAHNSVLWLISIGGAVGFAMLWVPFSIVVFLGIRAYRFSDNWMDKTIASTCIAALVSYFIQAWGDMGTQSLMSGQLISAAIMLIGKLSYANGAWPAGIRLFGSQEEMEMKRQERMGAIRRQAVRS